MPPLAFMPRGREAGAAALGGGQGARVSPGLRLGAGTQTLCFLLILGLTVGRQVRSHSCELSRLS